MLPYLQFLHIHTGIIRETLSVCNLDVCLLQLIGQIIPHLSEKENEWERELEIKRTEWKRGLWMVNHPEKYPIKGSTPFLWYMSQFTLISCRSDVPPASQSAWSIRGNLSSKDPTGLWIKHGSNQLCSPQTSSIHVHGCFWKMDQSIANKVSIPSALHKDLWRENQSLYYIEDWCIV